MHGKSVTHIQRHSQLENESDSGGLLMGNFVAFQTVIYCLLTGKLILSRLSISKI